MTFVVWKYIRKSKLLILLILLLFFVTYGFAIFFSHLGMTGFSLLHTIARYNFYICFFIVIISYYCISSASRNYIKEVSEAIAGRAVYENNSFLFVSCIVLIWNVGMCLILVFCSNLNDGTGYFIKWFPVNYMCNIIIPQLICVAFTYIISYSENSSRWIMLEIGFLFLISPFSEEIIWTAKPDFPVDVIWNTIHWPFEILYQNGEWSPDVQNDFQLEKVRIFVLIFWCVLLTGVSLFYIIERKKMGTLMILLSVIALIISYKPSSLYRLNSSWTGVNSDYWYYDVENEELEFEANDVRDYKINEYDLNVSFDYELYVSGNLSIVSESDSNEFEFTLYHGYKVIKMTSSVEGLKVKYIQNGDVLLVKTDKPVDRFGIYIEYKGYHNKYYSNSNGALLPGFFPWYPMPGNKQILLKYNEYGGMFGYNPYNRISPSHIILRTKKNLVTNLDKKAEEVYEGNCDSITVMMGNIVDTGDNEIIDYLPLALYKGYEEDSFIEDQKKTFHEALNKMKTFYYLDTSEIQDKKIIFASKDVGRNNINNFFVIFDNYILAAPGYVTCNEMMHYLILGDKSNSVIRESSPLLKLFLMTNFDDEPDEIVDNLIEEMRYRRDHASGYSDVLKNVDDWIDVLSTIDSKYFIKNMAHYLMDPTLYSNENSFLYKMKENL